MERNDYCNMSNSELKLLLVTLENEYEAKHNEILRISDELNEIKKKYNNINNELNSRKNLFL
jgi:hypothetical protein